MIKRVRLVNIKSHIDTTIEFSTGINLIEGDVGSGKTTILQSIESAIFGYEIKNMLRLGESSGEVTVEFEPELKVDWRITRRGVGGGHIVQNGSRSDLAASEIRSFFVKKFGLGDSPQIRSEPTLFRLAVYVRQEELKSILKGGSEVEELVRAATGVRLYSIARENAASILRPWLVNQVENLDKVIRVLEENISQASGVEDELRKAEEDLSRANSELMGIEEEYRVVSKEFESTLEIVRKLEEQRANVEGELNETERNIEKSKGNLENLSEQIFKKEEELMVLKSTYRNLASKAHVNIDPASVDVKEKELVEEIRRLTDRKTRFERDLQDLEDHKRRIAELRDEIGSELDYEALGKQRDQVETRKKELYGEVAKVEKIISDYTQIAETGVCPVCGNKIPSDQYTAHLAELKNKLVELRSEAKSLDDEGRRLVRLMEQAKVQMRQKKEIERLEAEINKITERLVYEDFDDEINMLNMGLEAARKLKEVLHTEKNLEEMKTQYQSESDELEKLTEKSNSLRS
ncbi:MAG: hypothetical protein QXP58_06005, partial [Thermoprotei archaeon]